MPGSTNKVMKILNKGGVAARRTGKKVLAAVQYAGDDVAMKASLLQLEALSKGAGIMGELSLDEFDEEAEKLYQGIDKHFSTISDDVLGAFLYLPAQLSRLVEMACRVTDVQAKHKHEVKQIVVAYTKAVYSAGAAVPLVLTAAKFFFKDIADNLFPKGSFIEKMFSKWANKIGKLAEKIEKVIDTKVDKLKNEFTVLDRLTGAEETARRTLQSEDKLRRS